MHLLKTQLLPLIEAAMEGLGLDPSLAEKMLQPAREPDQGDLSLPCFPLCENAWDGACGDCGEHQRGCTQPSQHRRGHCCQRLPEHPCRTIMACRAIVGRRLGRRCGVCQTKCVDRTHLSESKRTVSMSAEPETPFLETHSSVCTVCGATTSPQSIMSMIWGSKSPCWPGLLNTFRAMKWSASLLAVNL